MPYAAAVTQSVFVVSGRRHWLITIAETLAASGSEYEIPNLPKVGTIKSFHATLEGGTGTTINPIIGNASGFSADTQEHVGTQTTTAADVNDATDLPFVSGSGSLFIRSTVNDATADHTITTTIVIADGVQA